MPYLKKNDDHVCPLCPYSTIRKHMKHHLTTAGKKGPRCPGLKKVIPSDVWKKDILPHYVSNAKLPDLDMFRKTLEGLCTGVQKSIESKIAKNELKHT